MKPFRFGIQLWAPVDASSWRELARRAETLGYAVLDVPDHVGDQLGPIAAMMAAADAAPGLRVGTFVFDNDFRHPALLAQELATLDLLSDGRLEIGIGAGWLGPDYTKTGIAFDTPGTRVSRLEESIAVLKGSFLGESFSFAGKHYQVNELVGPRPAQRPHPPLMIAGGGPRLLRLAAREADIVAFAPRTRADGSGIDVRDGSADATARKVAVVRDAAGARFDGLELNAIVFRTANTDDALRGNVHILSGSVSEMCDELVERRERFGISYWVVQAVMEEFAPVVARLAGT